MSWRVSPKLETSWASHGGKYEGLWITRPYALTARPSPDVVFIAVSMRSGSVHERPMRSSGAPRRTDLFRRADVAKEAEQNPVVDAPQDPGDHKEGTGRNELGYDPYHRECECSSRVGGDADEARRGRSSGATITMV